jgi:hypothetical protein
MRPRSIPTLVYVAAIAAISSSPVVGQTPGPELFDSVSVKTLGVRHDRCHLHRRYIVVEDYLGLLGSGTTFFIRPATSGRCDADSIAGDFVIWNRWAESFCGIRNDVLFLDRGTGPDERSLILYDLTTRKKIREILYAPDHGVVPGPDSLTLGVWVPADMRGRVPKCPTPDGLVPGVDSLFWLGIRTGKTRYAGRTRCVGRE